MLAIVILALAADIMARGALSNRLRPPSTVAFGPTTSPSPARDDIFSPRPSPTLAFRPFSLAADPQPAAPVSADNRHDAAEAASDDDPAFASAARMAQMARELADQDGYAEPDRLAKLTTYLRTPITRYRDPKPFANVVWDDRAPVGMVGKCLGGGSFGVAYEFRQLDDNGTLTDCVIKVSANCGHVLDGWEREQAILARLYGVRGVAQLLKTTAGPDYVYLVVQAGNLGSLDSYIDKVSLEPGHVLYLAKELVSALAEMHAREVVHLDIKVENIVLTDADHASAEESRYFGRARPLFIDFGLSHRMVPQPRNATVGTDGYMAPEIMSRGEISYAADLWSLGCVLLELVELRPIDLIVHAAVPDDLKKRIEAREQFLVGRIAARGPIDDWFQSDLWDTPMGDILRAVITRCLKTNPDDRPTAALIRDMLKGYVDMWLEEQAMASTNLLAPPGATAPSSTASPSPKPSPLAPPPEDLAPTTAPTSISTESRGSPPPRPNAPEPPSSMSKSASSSEIVAEDAPKPRPAPRRNPAPPRLAGSDGDVLTFWADIDLERLELAATPKGPKVRFGALPVPDRGDQAKATAKSNQSRGKLKLVVGKMAEWVRKIVR